MVETIIETETRYEQLNNIDLLMLVRRGFISLHILDWKIFYEKYLQEYDLTGSKMQAYSNVAEDYNVSIDTIKRAVKYMTS